MSLEHLLLSWYPSRAYGLGGSFEIGEKIAELGVFEAEMGEVCEDEHAVRVRPAVRFRGLFGFVRVYRLRVGLW